MRPAATEFRRAAYGAGFSGVRDTLGFVHTFAQLRLIMTPTTLEHGGIRWDCVVFELRIGDIVHENGHATEPMGASLRKTFHIVRTLFRCTNTRGVDLLKKTMRCCWFLVGGGKKVFVATSPKQSFCLIANLVMSFLFGGFFFGGKIFPKKPTNFYGGNFCRQKNLFFPLCWVLGYRNLPPKKTNRFLKKLAHLKISRK